MRTKVTLVLLFLNVVLFCYVFYYERPLRTEIAARDFLARSLELNDRCGAKVREYMQSERPGSWAVPRAILYRYWKRIVANLAGIVTAAIEPLQSIDYLDDGKTDIDD